MPHNSYSSVSGRSSATYTFSSYEKGNDIPQVPRLACPVSGCSLVFKGEIAHGYLWRHLKRPGVRGRSGEDKVAWENRHKIEHDRLLATRVTPAQRKREAKKAKAQKLLRTAEFELLASNMGIVEKALVEQKVVIWEGMYAAQQRGDSVEYDAWVLLDFSTAA